MDRSLKLGLWLGTALCFATAAFGVDGVIEINQAAVRAGGITPGDTPGFPASLNQEGSYRLTGNLDVRGEATPENVTAIVVAAGAVTIDLNGFAIIGPAVCNGNPPSSDIMCAPTGSGKGILRMGNGTVTVRNGTIKGMGNRGLDLGAQALVEGVRAMANGDDGILVASDSIVRNCVATGNMNGGIDIQGSGVASGNVANHNGNTGIVGNLGTAITGNSATENYGNGIDGDTLVIGNAVFGNVLFGLVMGGGAGYANNVINNNGSGTVSGGAQMPPNICGGDLTCP